ncbi:MULTISPECIES: hypothetical protein [Pantoea]|uniref:hypothetical protein n=1 Tax=Pantoea TaxID=53335 RepID=UPI000FDB653B|nr:MULTISPECIES: hypothetical protein [Pantoea]
MAAKRGAINSATAAGFYYLNAVDATQAYIDLHRDKPHGFKKVNKSIEIYYYRPNYSRPYQSKIQQNQ